MIVGIWRRLVPSEENRCQRILGCNLLFVIVIAGVQLWIGLLWFFYWGYGIERGIILGGILAGLTVLRLRSQPGLSGQPAGAALLPRALQGLLIAAVLLDVGMMVDSDARNLRTSKIPMDEGQTSWRAARLLWRGENPYGFGALADLSAYAMRERERETAGVVTGLTGLSLMAELVRYDATLDPSVRRELLPASTVLSGAAATEMRIYGYKYGPVILLITAAVAPLGIPAAVLILNGLGCFALYGINWLILRRIAGPQLALAGVAILALLLDRHITRSYINHSATDVWALLFGSLAVLACMSRCPLAMAAAIAFSIGSKSLPGLLFLPLLLRFRSPYPVLLFVGLMGAIYLPWLLWDPQGILHNVFLWPLLKATSTNSWEYFAPSTAADVILALAACTFIAVWRRYLLERETRLFWTLAVSSILPLIATGYLANNYIPWASLWVVAAIVEAFATHQLVKPSPERTECQEPATMRVTTIVTTYNSPKALHLCLQSLVAQGDRGFEIVVADDGSDVATRAVIAKVARETEIPLHHIWQEDDGFRAATIRNRAIAASSGDYLVFLDGDCIALADFIRVHKRLAEPSWFVTGRRSNLGPQVTERVLRAWPMMPKTGRFGWFALALLRQATRPFHFLRVPLGPLRKRTPTAWKRVYSCNLAVWRRDLEAVNGFDERYVGHGSEDTDLVIRLLRAGVRRKRGDVASIVLHLHHPRRPGSSRNTGLFTELLGTRRSRAVIGLTEARCPKDRFSALAAK